MKLLGELRTLMEFSALTCAPGGGRIERISVPLHHGEVEFPESGLEAILITGDLQFYDRKDVPIADRQLMGHVVSSEIAGLCDAGLLPAANSIGVVLVGDLYADPDMMSRGGTGDVDAVWEQFADDFRWVAGVAGNHDLFEGKDEFPNRLKRIENIYPLDGDVVSVDGLTIGGISGIEGNLRRPWRYDFAGFSKSAKSVLKNELDLLVLHQGPIGTQRGMRGLGSVNESLRAGKHTPKAVAFGHCHWPEPVDEHEVTTFLNSDARVILLTRPGSPIGI